MALVEIGGTVGDIESQPFLEAIRQLKVEVGQQVEAGAVLAKIVNPRKLKAVTNIIDLIQADHYDVCAEIKKTQESNNPIVSQEFTFSVNEVQFAAILKYIPYEGKILIHIQDFSIEKQLHEKYKEQVQNEGIPTLNKPEV